MKGYLGIDSARSGAACLIGPDSEMLALIGWKPVVRRKLPKVQIGSVISTSCEMVDLGALIPNRPGAIGAYIASKMRLAQISFGLSSIEIACESVYVGRNPKTTISLARFSGGIVSILEETFGSKASWVTPGDWRNSVLKIPKNTNRADAKEASVAYIPPMIGGLGGAIGKLRYNPDDLTDAAGIAAWLLSTGNQNESVKS